MTVRLTDTEVCDLLQVSPRTLSRLVRRTEQARIRKPYRRVGRSRRWREELLDDWLDDLEAAWRASKSAAAAGGSSAGATRTGGSGPGAARRAPQPTSSGETSSARQHSGNDGNLVMLNRYRRSGS